MRRLFIIFLILLPTLVFGQNFKPIMGTQISWAHPATDGLVGLWLFNEGPGNKVFDLSGNGYDGPFGGNVAWTTGLFGSALDFPGDAADAIEPGKPVFDCSKPFAFSVWINPDTAASQDAIIVKYAGSNGILLRRDGGTTLDVWLSNAVTQLTLTVNNGTWYHIFVTYDGEKTYVYVNAVLDPATPVTRTLTDNSLPFQIGKSSLGNYDGQLDALMIWQRYFTASEIALLYREPFCMFEKDNVALMTVEAPAPVGEGQIIFIQMSAVPIILVLLLVFMRKRNGN